MHGIKSVVEGWRISDDVCKCLLCRVYLNLSVWLEKPWNLDPNPPLHRCSFIPESPTRGWHRANKPPSPPLPPPSHRTILHSHAAAATTSGSDLIKTIRARESERRQMKSTDPPPPVGSPVSSSCDTWRSALLTSLCRSH